MGKNVFNKIVISILVLFVIITSCVKPKAKEEYKKTDLIIESYNLDTIGAFDSFVVKGNFPVVDTSLIKAYFQGIGEISGKAKIIFVSDSQYIFEVPEIENYGGPNNVIFEVNFGFSFNHEGVFHKGTIGNKLVYKPVFKYFNFGPDKVRKGQIITIRSSAEDNDYRFMRIKFSGTDEWLPPVGYDSFAYNNGSGVSTDGSGPAFRVPQNATDGFFQLKSNRLAAGTSSKVLTILNDMPSLQAGVWTERADYASRGANRTNLSGGGMQGAACFVIGEQVYVVGGTSLAPFDGFGSNEVWRFEPEFNAWFRMADFPGGRRVYASAFAINGKGYVGTGIDGDGQVKDDFWEYDPIVNKWQRKANFPGIARYLSIGFSVNNHGYMGTGRGGDDSQIFADMYQYNPNSNTWQLINPMPVPRSNAFSFVINDKVYIGGGINASSWAISDFYLFNPNNETWTAKASLPHQRTASIATFTINGKGYAGAGRNGLLGMTQGSKEMYYYNVQNDNWTQMPDVGNESRANPIGFSVNNVGYIGLGAATGSTYTYRDIWGYKE